jgi:hypothetical protein
MPDMTYCGCGYFAGLISYERKTLFHSRKVGLILADKLKRTKRDLILK